MASKISRRRFIGTLAATTIASSIPARAIAATTYFDQSIAAAPPGIQIGYAAITWGDQEKQAIEDISSAGYRGIQLRANVVRDFQAAELRDLLQQNHLTMVALSSGNVHVEPSQEASDIALHTANAKFLRDAGGLYLQLIDQEPKSQHITAADYKQLGRLITEIGKRAADLGIQVGYHNHLNSLSEHPEGLDRVMDASDPRYVKFELDIAHYQAGGGDPAKAIMKYADRLLFLHIKDLGDPGPNPQDPKNAENFVELGRGKVDLPAVFVALHKTKFRGWAVVELDHEPDKSRTPKESAMISKKYLEEKLGLTI